MLDIVGRHRYVPRKSNEGTCTMTYERFESLPVWQSAMDLAAKVYELTRDRAFNAPGDLPDPLRRAALSVSNNIAEGFERGSTAELLAFLYLTRGSAGEVRYLNPVHPSLPPTLSCPLPPSPRLSRLPVPLSPCLSVSLSLCLSLSPSLPLPVSPSLVGHPAEAS